MWFLPTNLHMGWNMCFVHELGGVYYLISGVMGHVYYIDSIAVQNDIKIVNTDSQFLDISFNSVNKNGRVD